MSVNAGGFGVILVLSLALEPIKAGKTIAEA